MMKKKRQVLQNENQPFIPFWEDIDASNEITSRYPFLSDQEVHVWLASLDGVSGFYDYLSMEEMRKADRFRLQRDKQRYMLTHGILRCILGAYFGCEPSSLRFERSLYGKPSVTSQNVEIPLGFNMSHSEDMVCFILSKGHEVGIDIEKINDDFDWGRISRLFFTPKEVAYLQLLPREEQIKYFFLLWTRKEALLKAVGTGLSDLENINGIENDYRVRNYPLISFTIGENYQAAFAVNNEISTIRYFRFITNLKK
jgi:4'-phosphopantetheinyl transferase